MTQSMEILPPLDPRKNKTIALVAIAPALPTSAKEGKRPPLEKDIHRQALAFYYALGPNRTLEKVAERFNVKQSLVEQWSSRFNWKDRIAALESRSKSDHFRDKISDLLLLLLDSLTKPDEKSGVPVLTSSAKTTAETVKLCVAAFKELRQDQREGEPGEDDFKGPGKSALKPGVMVNVIIRGLEEPQGT